MSLFKNLFRTNKATLFRSKPRRPSNRPRLTLESLESRSLLAAAPISAPVLLPQSMDSMDLAALTSVSVKAAGQSGKVVDPEPELSDPALVGLSGKSTFAHDPDPELASPETRILSSLRAFGFIDGPHGDGHEGLPQPGEQPNHLGPLSELVPGGRAARPPLPWEQADRDPEAFVDGFVGGRRSDRPSQGSDSGRSPFARVGWVSDFEIVRRDSTGTTTYTRHCGPDGSYDLDVTRTNRDGSSSTRGATWDRSGTIRQYYEVHTNPDGSSRGETKVYGADGSFERTIKWETDSDGTTRTYEIPAPKGSQPDERDGGSGLSLLGGDPWLLFFTWYTDTGAHPHSMEELLARIRATHTDSWDTGDGSGGGSGDAAPRVGPEAVTSPPHHAGVVTSGGYRAPGGGGLPVDPDWPGTGGSPSR